MIIRDEALTIHDARSLRPPEDALTEAVDWHHPNARGQHLTPAHFANFDDFVLGIDGFGLDTGEFHLSCSFQVFHLRKVDAPNVVRRIPFVAWIRSSQAIRNRQPRSFGGWRQGLDRTPCSHVVVGVEAVRRRTAEHQLFRLHFWTGTQPMGIPKIVACSS